MRILFLTSSNQPRDGYSVVGHNITQHLRNTFGHDLQVCTSERKRSLALSADTLKSTYAEKYGLPTLLHDFLLLLWLGRGQKFDLVHCNVEHFAPVARWLSRAWRCPYTITAHGTYGVLLPFGNATYKQAFQDASKVICVSDFTANSMRANRIAANFAVIRNGVDKSVFKTDGTVRKENYLTFVGNTKRRKGFSVLLDALTKLPADTPTFAIKAVGNFNDLTPDTRLSLGNQTNARIEFLSGLTEADLVKLYQGAKLNVLPSQTEPMYFEGFGLVHLEANACGTLTVGTRSSGNVEAIPQGNGFLIEQDDTDELARIISNVMREDDVSRLEPKMADALRDWSDVATEYHNLFTELVPNRSTRLADSNP